MTTSVVYSNEMDELKNDPNSAIEMAENRNEGKTLVEVHIKKSPYPKAVFFIIGNEFCERFCYFGMRAILVLYFMDHLSWNNSTATGVYHAFIVGCCFTPVLGAILADGYIGKYRTILYLSMVYTVGSALMSFTAFPPPFWLGPVIGLILIALGTGGIKPCVSAFGGDQFKKDQERERSGFFSAFYFAINLGSFFSIILTPIIKDGVLCFGKKCFPLAFAVPAILMIISTGLFILGKRWYILNPPEGSVITNFFKCIGSALKNKFRSRSSHKQHWLDHAGPEFQTSFLEDVKRVFKVLTLYIPVPVFWALFDQQGSRWTIQSANLNRQLNEDWHFLPEQIQAINPILILIFIPLFDMGVYPLMDKLKIPNRPLQRMVVGMLLTSLSFVASGILQLRIEGDLHHLENNNSFVTLVNLSPCELKVKGSLPNIDLRPWEPSLRMSIPSSSYDLQVERIPDNCSLELSSTYQFTFVNPQCYLVVFSVGGVAGEAIVANGNQSTPVTTTVLNVGSMGPTLYANAYSYDLNKDPTGECFLRIILVGPTKGNISFANIKGVVSSRQYYYKIIDQIQNKYIQVSAGRYNVMVQDVYEIRIVVASGGKYTLIINNDQGNLTHLLVEDIRPNTVSVWLQLPQYIIITLGEVAFSVTGLSFAYSQAPASMKSVVQASWFLTTGFGNVIDVIVASSAVIPNQAAEFFFFAILMFVTTIIFAILASYYHYYDDHSIPYEDLDSKPSPIRPAHDSGTISDVDVSLDDAESKSPGRPFDWRKLEEKENGDMTIGR